MEPSARNDRQRATEVARELARAAALLQHLAAENARLRERIRQIRRERSIGRDEPSYADLQAMAKSAHEELERAHEEHRDLAARCTSLEEEHQRIAELYNAMHQLHSARGARGVVQTIGELLRELVRAERFGIYLYDERSSELRLTLAVGPQADAFPAVAPPEGSIWRALGASAVVSPEREGGDACEPPVVVALRVDQRPIGAVVIRELHADRCGFRPMDHELFRVLATHAAMAILTARLHTVSERKRATMDGLIELLTR